MQPSSSFDAELSARLAPILSGLDAERARLVQRAQNGIIGGIVVFLVALLVLAALHLSGWWFAAPFVAGVGVWAAFASSARSEYTREFKMLVMPELVRAFGDLSYAPDAGLSESDFNATRLFPSPDRWKSHDLITGKVGATKVQCCEVHAEERRETRDSEGRTSTTYETIFKGLFFIADFNKAFGGQTFITPEGFTHHLGGLGQFLQRTEASLSGHGQMVHLEDPEFERTFQVASTDQVEARYLLSTSFMRRLLDLRQRRGSNVYAAFLFGQLFLLIAQSQDYFEPPSLGTPLDVNALAPTIAQLNETLGIVNELDLNTRIWSKQ